MLKKESKMIWGLMGVKQNNLNVNKVLQKNNQIIAMNGVYVEYDFAQYWANNNEKVMCMASENIDEKEKLFYNYRQRYKHLFLEDIAHEDIENNINAISNIFKCRDIKQFGSEIIGGDINGAVSIGYGENKNNEAKLYHKDGNTFIEEAHFLHHFSITLDSYNEIREFKPNCNYNEEDFKFFKDSCISAIKGLSDSSKIEYVLFGESKMFLPSYIVESIKLETKESGKNVLDITKLSEYFESLDEKDKIELYVDSTTTKVNIENECFNGNLKIVYV